MEIENGERINFANLQDETLDHPGENNDSHLAFRTTEEEISTVKQRLASRSVKVRETRTSIYFRDPDDNFLELTHWNGPSE
jgi:hypothetical protein